MPTVILMLMDEWIDNYLIDVIENIINDINSSEVFYNFSDGPNFIDLEELTTISKTIIDDDTTVGSLKIFNNNNNDYRNYNKNNLFKLLSDTWFVNYDFDTLCKIVSVENLQSNYNFNNFTEILKINNVINKPFLELYQLNIDTNTLNSGMHVYEMCIYKNKLFPIFTSTLIKAMYFYYNTGNYSTKSYNSSDSKTTNPTGGAGDVSDYPFFINKEIQKSYQSLFKLTSIHSHLGYHIEYNKKVYFFFLTSKESYMSSDFDTKEKPIAVNNFEIEFTFKTKRYNNQYVNKIMVMDSEIFNQYFIILNGKESLPFSLQNLLEEREIEKKKNELFNNVVTAFKLSLESETFIFWEPKLSKFDESSDVNFFHEKKSEHFKLDIDEILKTLNNGSYLKQSKNNFFDGKHDINFIKINKALRHIKQHFK